MKLNVTGVETIEATDPQAPRQAVPAISPVQLPKWQRPRTRTVFPDSGWNWGRGLPPTSTPLPKWQENWKSREQMKEAFDRGYHQITQ